VEAIARNAHRGDGQRGANEERRGGEEKEGRGRHLAAGCFGAEQRVLGEYDATTAARTREDGKDGA